jgi:MOSC domain-containing protein YiiM
VKPVSVDGAASLGACVCALLELEPAGTPIGAGSHEWQEWLAARNLRLTGVTELPASGFWIGVGEGGEHVVMFGSPPDVVWDPAGGLAGAPVRGYVISALDPALPILAGPAARGAAPVPVPEGAVSGIYVAPVREGRCEPVDSAEAVAGRGLRGDRYFYGDGTFSPGTLSGRNLTLIEAEALDELAAEHGVELDPADARRNVLTRGIALNDLVGEEFMVGEARCVGRRWCEPCAHLQRLTVDGTLRGLVHRGGLRADVVGGGKIAVGDPVRVVRS